LPIAKQIAEALEAAHERLRASESCSTTQGWMISRLMLTPTCGVRRVPDGNFVIRLTQPYKPPTHYDLVIDWFKELRRLVPVGQ